MEQDINSSHALDMPILLRSGAQNTLAASHPRKLRATQPSGALCRWGEREREREREQCPLRSGKNVGFKLRDLS